ncbi:MAG: hypothetical protein IKU62_04325 [Ruminiclostridium sp.]|nr:hypothetical protein [Ruminiclostridium sp.]
MRKLFVIVMLLFLLSSGLTGCTSQPSMEPPTLTVGGTMEVNPGLRSWNVKQGLGKWMSQEASTVFPLDYPDDYPAFTLPEDGIITLDWDIAPDSYSISYWTEDVWLDGTDAVMTDGQIYDQGFLMPEEDIPALVTVQAQWDQRIFRGWYGSVGYVFRVIPNT